MTEHGEDAREGRTRPARTAGAATAAGETGAGADPGKGGGGEDAAFARLVAETEGLQPWRRLFHAANGVLVVLALTTLPVETWLALIILGAALLVAALMDVLRLASPALNRLFFRAFSSLASPREAEGVASSTWYVAGMLLALLLFPRPWALGGILVLALADPAAGFVGRSLGTRTFGAGTWEGSATFAGVAFLALLPFAPWWAALAAALVTTLVEAVPWELDDNLTIPLAVGTTFLLLPGL